MLFNSTLTLSHISQHQISALKNSLAAHGDIFEAALRAFLVALLILALSAALYSGILGKLFFQDNIPYGAPEMEDINPFMGTGMTESM